MGDSVTIVNVGYRSTNFWVVSAGRSRLLVDLGWAGRGAALLANLRRMDIPLAEITHGFATHYHMDHAGAAQELKDLGMRLIVTTEQVPAIEAMNASITREPGFVPIRPEGNCVIGCAESRELLERIGLAGELIPTPGHSEDSVSLLLDGGDVFTGDLTPPSVVTPETASMVLESWRRLAGRGARRVHPGHGPVRPMPAASRLEDPDAANP